MTENVTRSTLPTEKRIITEVRRPLPGAFVASKLNVFISYSRSDLAFADQLDMALGGIGFETSIDRHDIAGADVWKRRLGDLIRQADAVVFVLTAASGESDICAWEVDEALRFGKRIIPVLPRSLGTADVPSRLADLNYIYFYEEPSAPGSGFGAGLVSLIAALNEDPDWIREHTRLLSLATSWDTAGRPTGRLLSGDDIIKAKAWLAERRHTKTEPTDLHRTFIRASEDEAAARTNADRKRLEEMASVQAERAKALAAAEDALKQAADARRRRAMLRNALLALMTIAAISSTILGISLRNEKVRFEEQKIGAEKQAEIAKEEARKAQEAGQQSLLAREDALRSQRLSEARLEQAEANQRRADAERQRAESMLGTVRQAMNVLVRTLPDRLRRPTIDRDQIIKDVFESARHLMDEYQRFGGSSATDVTQKRDTTDAYVRNFERLLDVAVIRRDADAGDALAMLMLGRIHLRGDRVAKDVPAAIAWFEKSAKANNHNAMNWLGLLHYEGVEVPKDYAKSREWYVKAAQGEHPAALNQLGWLYQNGLSVEKDPQQALQWYRRAADAGNRTSMYNIAHAYHNSRGVAQDYAQAMEWYRKSADAGYPPAFNQIGFLHQGGLGVPPDPVKAREWYEKAASAGNASGSWNLALTLDRARGGPPDYPRAAKLVLIAAASQSETAKRALQGTLSTWNVVTRTEVKRELQAAGHYKGTIDDIWDDAAKAAADAYLKAAEAGQ